MRIKPAAFLLFFVMIFAADGKAQLLNVESIRAEADSSGWYGQLEFNFSINQYNERVIEFSNASNISYFSKNHAYLLLNKLKLVNLNGNSVISSGYGHLRSTFLRKQRLSPELFLQYQYNNNLGLENRMLAGIGIRYTFHKSEHWSGSFSTGLMDEREEWQLESQEAIVRNRVKSTNNISIRGNINPRASFLLVGYYQAPLNNFFEPRAILESRLKTKVSDHVALSISFVSSYDVNPVIDIPQWTYELTNGILITF